jgi:predicted RNA binding protein YcfA (HicA-like mRNA interferase family)
MPSFGAISRRDLIYFLKQLGFNGPYSGGKHQYMIRDELKLTIPNPHKTDISVGLLNRILRQANISREEWEAL